MNLIGGQYDLGVRINFVDNYREAGAVTQIQPFCDSSRNQQERDNIDDLNQRVSIRFRTIPVQVAHGLAATAVLCAS